MKIKQFTLGGFQSNCYIAINESNNFCFMIDPGAEGEFLVDYLKKNNLILKFIVLTHGHVDHIGGVEPLVSTFHAPVYAGRLEKNLLQNPKLNLSYMDGSNISITSDYFLEDQEVLKRDGFTLKILETPGHTIGGICIYMDNYLFTGDTLFQGSIGRTDFPTGDYETIMESIIKKILKLPVDTTILPGHGPASSIAIEKKGNPFILNYENEYGK